MTVDIEAATKYFDEEVFHNELWTSADDKSKSRALKNADNMLSRHYPNRDIPNEAVFEQALWVMKVSDARKQAEQGVVSYSIDGISVSLSQVDRSIAPNVLQIVGRRVGQSISGRQGWIHSKDDQINTQLGRGRFY